MGTRVVTVRCVRLLGQVQADVGAACERPQRVVGAQARTAESWVAEDWRHVLYVTPIFGYPAFGGPRLRTYNTLRALARCADVSLYLTQQPDTADRDHARAHLLGFCREVCFPKPPPGPS